MKVENLRNLILISVLSPICLEYSRFYVYQSLIHTTLIVKNARTTLILFRGKTLSKIENTGNPADFCMTFIAANREKGFNTCQPPKPLGITVHIDLSSKSPRI